MSKANREPTKTRRWTIVLDRVPLYEEHDAAALRIRERLYRVKELLIDGEPLRCRAATLTMAAGEALCLSVEVMPRDLEILIEEEPCKT